jgi:arylsulfatase A-like enzyme
VPARRFTLLAIALSGFALLGGGVQPAAAATRPNILVIVTDDQRAGLRAMPETRKLFVRHGVSYKRAYVTDPLCCPSRASIMTGRYPHNTGVRTNTAHPEYGVFGGTALDASTTIQHYLHGAGYSTALFGKYLNQWDFNQPPPYFDTFTMVRAHGDYVHNLVSSGHAGETPIVHTSTTYSTTIVRRPTLRFLRSHNDPGQPFFLYVAPHAPHSPFTPEPKYSHDSFGEWNGNPAVFEKDLSDKPEYVQQHDGTLRTGRRIRTRQFRTLESVDDLVQAIFAQLRQWPDVGRTRPHEEGCPLLALRPGSALRAMAGWTIRPGEP